MLVRLVVVGVLAGSVGVAEPASAEGSLATLYANPSYVAPGDSFVLYGKEYSGSLASSNIEIRLDSPTGRAIHEFTPRVVIDNQPVTMPLDVALGPKMLVETQRTLSTGTAITGTPGRATIEVSAPFTAPPIYWAGLPSAGQPVVTVVEAPVLVPPAVLAPPTVAPPVTLAQPVRQVEAPALPVGVTPEPVAAARARLTLGACNEFMCAAAGSAQRQVAIALPAPGEGGPAQDPTRVRSAASAAMLALDSADDGLEPDLPSGGAGEGQVNTATGNYWQAFDDVASIPGRGVPLGLRRTYNAQSTAVEGLFGHGWSWTYGMRLRVLQSSSDPQAAVIVTQENGATATFTRSGPSQPYVAPPWIIGTLAHHPADSTTPERFTVTRGPRFGSLARETFTFDSSGAFLLSIRDWNGHETKLTWSPGGLVVEEPAGRRLQFRFERVGIDNRPRVRDVVDPEGRVVTYRYDSLGDLTDVFDVTGPVPGTWPVPSDFRPAKGHWAYGYGGDHLLTSVRSPRYANDSSTPARVTTVAYERVNESWVAKSVTSVLGQTTRFAYFSAPGGVDATVTTYPDNYGPSAGRLSGGVQVWDEYVSGALKRHVRGYDSPEAALWSFVRDPVTAGVDRMNDPSGGSWQAGFDWRGNQLWSADPLGRVTRADFGNNPDSPGNAKDLPQSVTDGRGIKTTLTYLAPNLEKVTEEGSGAVTTLKYGSSVAGRVMAVVEPEYQSQPGVEWKYGYDQWGVRNSVTDPLGNKTSWVLDRVGRLVSAPRQGSGDDVRDRSRRSRDVGQCPDEPCHRAGVRPGPEHAVGDRRREEQDDFEHDPAGRQTAVIRPLPDPAQPATPPGRSSTRTELWGDGSVRRQLDGANEATSYDYDTHGRVLAVTDPLGRTTRYGYDMVRNKATKADHGGSCTVPVSRCTTTVYDVAGQVREVRYSDRPADNVTIPVDGGYDQNGRRTRMIDRTGLSTWAYDNAGRLESHTDGAGATVGYGWDRNDRLKEITYPGGPVVVDGITKPRSVTRTFNAANRVEKVTDWLGNPTTFAYEPTGPVKTRTSPSTAGDVVDTFTNNLADEVESIGITRAGASLATFGYGRDDNGHVESVTSTGLADTHTYAYTGLNQLRDVDGPAYGYDVADNLNRLPVGVQRFDRANQLCWTSPTATTGPCTDPAPADATRYTYDESGNRKSKQPAVGAASVYDYDQANRLVSASTPGVSTGAGQYKPLPTPVRAVDTRLATGCATTAPCPVAVNETRQVQITGTSSGSVPAGADAVVVNVTAVGPTGTGHLTVFQAGATPPATSNVNYVTGQTIANQATVKLSTTGAVAVRASSGATNVIVDVLGWFTAPTGAGGSFTTVTPERAVDTRFGIGACSDPATGSFRTCARLTTATDVTVKLTGVAGVPATGVAAVAVNLTAVYQAADGYLQVWPAQPNSSPPGASTLNYQANKTLSGFTTAMVSADGKITIRTSAPTDLIIDIAGWYATTSDPNQSVYTPTTPTRITDTRTGLGTCTTSTATQCATIQPGVPLTIQVGGKAGVPPIGATASLNITAISGTSGYIVAHRQGSQPPNTTTLSTIPNQAVSNAAVVPLSETGKVTIAASHPTDVMIDVNGWYHPPTQTHTYTYNGDGLRTAKTIAGTTTTRFTWSQTGGIPLLLQEGGDAYIYGPDNRPISKISNSTTVTRHHQDQLGSTRLLTNTSGTITATYTYDAYGNTTNTTGTATTNLRYTGEYTDTETGLIYLRNRYYDPTTAQFLTRDPITAITRSPYAYVKGNPLNLTDPLGLCEDEEAAEEFPGAAARSKVPPEWGPGNPTSKGSGIRWNPDKSQGVRIDQANPNSPFPSQQIDHVVVRSGGRILGPDGQPIMGRLKQNPGAHIPLSDWLNWSAWNVP